MDANGIGLCGRCSIVHTDPTLGVGPSAFALENLKQGLTGCTECSGCDTRRFFAELEAARAIRGISSLNQYLLNLDVMSLCKRHITNTHRRF